MDTREKVERAFAHRYKEAPALVVRAPGRVNLIGEHTDYNDGFVLPMAIDRAIWIALRPRADRRLELASLDFEEIRSVDLDRLQPGDEGWVDYVKGVAWALSERGERLGGWEGVIGGDIPVGAGLSSSAALELATARAFAAVSGFDWDPTQMARLAQRAENEWVGVNCGIMDQLISAAGQEGHALMIDCRSLGTFPVPLPPQCGVVVMDTGTRRGLVDSAYNQRREQCERAAQFFGVAALRDVPVALFERRADDLDELTRRRARHVITENERTLRAADAMRQQDAATLGLLMNASHRSLRDDFEVSSPALDAIVDIARSSPACLGARMTGAGFGGCAVALVREDAIRYFVEATESRYRTETGNEPALYVCQPTDGAAVILDRRA